MSVILASLFPLLALLAPAAPPDAGGGAVLRAFRSALRRPADLRASSAPDGAGEAGRDLYLLKRRYGRNAPLRLGFSAGAGVLIPEKAGRPVPGAPPRERPTYAEAFGTGLTARIEAAFAFRPILSLLATAGVERYPGCARTEGVFGRVRYTDLWIAPLRFGLRLGVPLSLPRAAWGAEGFSPARKGARPFLECLVGLAYRAKVDLEPLGSYWKAATVFSASASLGLEVGFGPLAVVVAADFVYHSEPPERPWYAEPEAALGVFLRGGLTWRF
jgi:hypothetical protein